MRPKYQPLTSGDEESAIGFDENNTVDPQYELGTLDESYGRNAEQIARFFAVVPSTLMDVRVYTKCLRDANDNIPDSLLGLSAKIGKVYNDLCQFYDPAELTEITCKVEELTSFHDFLILVSTTLGVDRRFPARLPGSYANTENEVGLQVLKYACFLFMLLFIVLAMGIMVVGAFKIAQSIRDS